MKAVPNRPILIPLQPHISQEIFHPNYLRPMGRHETAEVLARLLVKLGWVKDTTEDSASETDDRGKYLYTSRGVTVVSHSKYVVDLSKSED